MKRITVLLFFVLVGNLIVAQGEVEKKMMELMEITKAPGMNFSFIDPEGNQYDYSAGYADVSTREQMTPEHSMFSGSIGKTYAIAVIAQLVDEGLIDLNKKYIEYFPEVEWLQNLPNYNAFTVLELMQHRSGLPRYAFKMEVWEMAKNDPDKIWSYKDRLSIVFGDTAVHESGEGFAYSDTGYVLLAMLIEKITGHNLYDVIRARVLNPLKLEQTYAADRRTFPISSNTYSKEELFQMPGPVFINGICKFNPQLENAGGGYVNTTSDLAKWAKLYFEGAPFSEKMRNTIQTISPNGLAIDKGWSCGAGIFLLESKYGIAYGHTGLMVGTRSIMLYFPDYEISAAMQMNTDVAEGDLGLLGCLELLIDAKLKQ